MVNTLALMLPVGYAQCDAEGAKGCLLVMANYGCHYAALIKFWSFPYHSGHLIPLPKG
jgi:hypothetical protein